MKIFIQLFSNKSQMENLKKAVNHAIEDGIKVDAVILKQED